MDRKLEEQILKEHPSLFRDRELPSPMAFGIECGDGWFCLIKTLCSELEELNEENQIKAIQVKEKFGSLKFYTQSANKEQIILIEFVEDISENICENCGNLTNGPIKSFGQIVNLCKNCTSQK